MLSKKDLADIAERRKVNMAKRRGRGNIKKAKDNVAVVLPTGINLLEYYVKLKDRQKKFGMKQDSVIYHSTEYYNSEEYAEFRLIELDIQRVRTIMRTVKTLHRYAIVRNEDGTSIVGPFLTVGACQRMAEAGIVPDSQLSKIVVTF